MSWGVGRMETERAGWLYLLHGGEVAVLVRSLDAFRLPSPLRGEIEVTQGLYVAHLSSWREEDEAAQVGSEQTMI